MHPSPSNVTLPRPSRNTERELTDDFEDYRSDPNFNRYQQPMSPKSKEPRTRQDKYQHEDSRTQEQDITKYLEKPISKFTDNKYLERQKSLDREKHKTLEYQKSLERSERCSDRQVFNGHKSLEKQNSRTRSYEFGTSVDFYHDELEKNGEYPERRYYEEDARKMEKSNRYFEDDGFDENMRYVSNIF